MARALLPEAEQAADGERRALLSRGLLAGGLALAGSVAAASAAHADGESLVAGSSAPQPLGPSPSPGDDSPEGSRADHVHPTTGLAVLDAPNTFLAGSTYTLPTTSDAAVSLVLGTEPYPRFTGAADGTLSWGSGAAPADVVLGRGGPGRLDLVGSLVVRHDAAGIDEPEVVLDTPSSGRARSISYTTGGVPRWALETDGTPETGGNRGSSFALRCFTDAGAPLRTAVEIARDTGDWLVLPSSSGTKPRMSIGDTAVTSGVKLAVKSTLGTALGLQTDVATGTGPVDVVVATASTTSSTLTDLFGSRLLFQNRKGSTTWNVAAVAALRDGRDDSGALVLQTANAGSLAERVRVTAAGNVGVGTSSAFGGGKGVLALGFATTVPTTDPVGGGLLYTTSEGLFWRGSAGTVTRLATA